MGAVSRNHDYRFDVQLAEGLAVEGWFYEMTRGGDRFEVKHDRRALETGQVYVETHDDPGARGAWRPSGISTSQADCWIFALGDPPRAFVGVPAERLKLLVNCAEQSGRVLRQRHGSCPTVGVGVPLTALLGNDDQALRAA